MRPYGALIGLFGMLAAPTAVLGGPPVVGIAVGRAVGSPGQTVHVSVTLNLLTTPPASVAAVVHEITFDPNTPIVSAAGNGEIPGCAVNPAINKEATTFAFVPDGCLETADCRGIAASVVSDVNDDPIPNGTTLYTCPIVIVRGTGDGTYPLVNSDVVALAPNGDPVPALGDNGAVVVHRPLIACAGDCEGDGVVSMSNLIAGVNINLGMAELATCPAFDRDGDGLVLVHELLQGIRGAQDGCVSDGAACERAAASALHTCIEQVSEAQLTCFIEAGAACPANDPGITPALTALADHVGAACTQPAAVQSAGYGLSSTPVGLVERLQAACLAEPASLAARTFGGPHGAALASADDEDALCLATSYRAGARLLGDQLSLYSNCVIADHIGFELCVPTQTDVPAAALRQQLADDIAERCGAGVLQTLIALDEAAYAARTAAQARCLAATAHPDSAPLTLDCGPRDGLVDTPRGEYVQVVLDEATYGTRCGDGSPWAFWIRLAPEGSPVENVVVGMQGGGVCIFNDDCRTRPADLFESLTDQPETSGPMSNDPEISSFADWTKVYLPYCNQDVFIGGGVVSNFPDITVHRFGAVNVRAALRYVRDVIWRELNDTSEDGYSPDKLRVLFGGFSAGAFGTLYNYHYVLDDLQWAHTAAYPDAGLALDNGETLGVSGLGALLIYGQPPTGWGSRNYVPPYCFAPNCGVGPVVLAATSPRLKAVPEQQFLILSNQVDSVQVGTTFFDSTDAWVNEMRQTYCETRDLPGVQYFMPAITQSVHVVSPRHELYTLRHVDGVLMRDWLESGFTAPDVVTDQVEEGTLVQDIPGVLPFPCPVAE